ncbi:hypothetical protein [Wolbachia endosymbiont of Chironomus riparius]|jgi:hypothetical protein|nr:hypothetical protein [Wolbachia endosymbiont of Chironomus riparius]
MKYEKVKELEEETFDRLSGVKKATQKKWQRFYGKEKKIKGGRKTS